MRLSWNEIRLRAARFATEWSDASYEKGESQSFYNDFFKIFGVQRRKVARYEEHVRKLDDRSGYIDLFWPGVLIVEQKSAGKDLASAYEQAGEYFDSLADEDCPRFVLVSDFQSFELRDLDEDEYSAFALADLPKHVEKFGFILGVQRRTFRDQDPVNLEATELMRQLHSVLRNSGYGANDPHALEEFLVRIVFCMFADDTGVFEPRDIFFDLLEQRTSEDGADLGGWLARLFEVLDTPEELRQAKLDADLRQFPYVNGELFATRHSIPDFDSEMRRLLLDACRFNWEAISPAIFGALFQSVMDPVERRAQGAHYTTEKNILKVIGPLFLDELKAEFERLRARRDRRRRSDLLKFRTKLANLNFFDPACGCGNFLVIAYRELRELEIEVVRELRIAGPGESQLVFRVEDLSQITVEQFFGIEIADFPARIAKTALWMMDHIMNNRLSMAVSETYIRIPIEGSPQILTADALEMDWADLLPPSQCSFVLGNPPFSGAKTQSPWQRSQIQRIANLGKSKGTLDYVAAWFFKAAEYLHEWPARIGFVATNSITQGEQVAQLWPNLLSRYDLDITFAHKTFAWGSDARGKAHVHVVIVGLESAKSSREFKRLFSYSDVTGEPVETRHAAISPYLLDASGLRDPYITVREEKSPINGLAELAIGSQPIDGGHYIFDSRKLDEFLAIEPDAERFMRPYFGAREFLHGQKRWVLYLRDAPVSAISRMPKVAERVGAVRAYRASSKRSQTRKCADTPTLFYLNVVPDNSFLFIPRVSSERREFAPIGWLSPPAIPSDSALISETANLEEFALISSSMHMAWLRHVGGRLESRYRYSAGVVYNTFPLPPPTAELESLRAYAQAVLDARTEHSDATLAEMYNPDLMPPSIRAAHHRLDRAVDRTYRTAPFRTERDRVEHMLLLYEEITSPLTSKPFAPGI